MNVELIKVVSCCLSVTRWVLNHRFWALYRGAGGFRGAPGNLWESFPPMYPDTSPTAWCRIIATKTLGDIFRLQYKRISKAILSGRRVLVRYDTILSIRLRLAFLVYFLCQYIPLLLLLLNLIISLIMMVVGPGGPRTPLLACMPLHFPDRVSTKSK